MSEEKNEGPIWHSRRINSQRRDARDRKKLNYQWLAGFIDGEGHFSISRFISPKGGFTYSCRIAITNCDYRVLNFIKEKYGGALGAHAAGHKGDDRGWRKSWRWTLSGPDAYDLALKIEPYLIVKSPALELLIIFWRYKETMSKLARPATLAHYHVRMKKLNRRGTVPPGGKLPEKPL
jgi:hypothetical protein